MARKTIYVSDLSRPRPNALAGAIESMLVIHFGILGSLPGCGWLPQLRAASSRKITPNTIFPQETVSDVLLLMAAPLALDTKYATPLTSASAHTQPARNMGPFTRALCENSIRITAMIGTGLIATPIANVRTALIPCPISSPPRPTASGHDPRSSKSHARACSLL